MSYLTLSNTFFARYMVYGAKLTIDPTVQPPPPWCLRLSVLLSPSSSLMSGLVSGGVVFGSLIPYTCLM